MTIAMPDSIRPQDMPKGYKAYLAYVDGERSKDADQVRTMFAGAQILTLTVLGGDAVADGCDRETGDLSPLGAALWLRGRITAGARRPVLYDSRDDVPDTLGICAEYGVTRQQIRILSAHYGAGQHICSPAACGAKFTADGTQWTDQFRTPAGTVVDMSLLADDFFGAMPPSTANWTEKVVKELPVVRQGQTGSVVRTVQGLCAARGRAVAVDGVFGPVTAAAVKAVQLAARVGADGIVGPLTWPVLLGVR